jgi:hypothetical protein
MSIKTTILKINHELISAFATLDSWFDTHFLTASAGYDQATSVIFLHDLWWHNEQLLKQIESTWKSRDEHANELSGNVYPYRFQPPSVSVIESTLSVDYSSEEILSNADLLREKFRDQLYRALVLLEMLTNGEGILHHIEWPVFQSSKYDLYQALYLLAKQTRHFEHISSSHFSSPVDWLI